MTPTDPVELLKQARGGDDVALGVLLERYRPYLRILAERRLDRRLRVRVDASDLVQRTCLDAHKDIGKFRGTAEPQLIAWLRQILEHNVQQSVQEHVLAQKRSINQERHAEDSENNGPAAMARFAAEQSSPSQRAMRGESAVLLAKALEQLPDDQREAVRLRHLEGWTLAEIADHFQRSEVAVAGLLKRGLQKLRQHFSESDESKL